MLNDKRSYYAAKKENQPISMTDIPVHRAMSRLMTECEWKPNVMEFKENVVRHIEHLDIPSHGSADSDIKYMPVLIFFRMP